MPADFVGKIGYYHGFGGGRIVFGDGTSEYIWDPKTTSWTGYSLSLIAANNNLPAIIPKTAYYYRFVNCGNYAAIGDINGDGIIDENDYNLINNINDPANHIYLDCANVNGDKDVDGNEVVNAIDIDYINFLVGGACPAGSCPINTLDSNGGAGNAEIHRWYEINKKAVLYSWNGTGKFVDITNKITGIPIDIAPTNGYYDKQLNKLVLWYGCEAYESANARNFVKIRQSNLCLGHDIDNDFISSVNDNCPDVYNPNQADSDNDLKGNVCDINDFIGLPTDFTPSLGYYHDIGTGVTSLWDKNGNVYVSGNGVEFKAYTSSQKKSEGIPINFLPIIGYYHPHGGNDGRISLWNANGVVYNFNKAIGKFILVDRNLEATKDLSAAFIPIKGYYDGFNRGVVALMDNKDYYLWHLNQADSWQKYDLTLLNQISGLPTDSVDLLYYYRFSNCANYSAIGDVNGDGDINLIDKNIAIDVSQSSNLFYFDCADINGDKSVNDADIQYIQYLIDPPCTGSCPADTLSSSGGAGNAGVQRWYDDGNKNIQLYAANGSGKFVDITNKLTGLPIDIAPNVGYYDKNLNKIILWYGCDAYAGDGILFSLIRDGSFECSTTLTNIPLSDNVCDRFTISGKNECENSNNWDPELKENIQILHKQFAEANGFDYDFCTNPPNNNVECGCEWISNVCIEKIELINEAYSCYTTEMSLTQSDCIANDEYKIKWTVDAENPAKGCISGEMAFQCPSKVSLPFFEIENFFISSILIFLLYIIINLLERLPNQKMK